MGLIRTTPNLSYSIKKVGTTSTTPIVSYVFQQKLAREAEQRHQTNHTVYLKKWGQEAEHQILAYFIYKAGQTKQGATCIIVHQESGHKQQSTKFIKLYQQTGHQKQSTNCIRLRRESWHKKQSTRFIIFVKKKSEHKKQSTKLIILDQIKWAQEGERHIYHTLS